LRDLDQSEMDNMLDRSQGQCVMLEEIG
jgi:hypothetical protein